MSKVSLKMLSRAGLFMGIAAAPSLMISAAPSHFPAPAVLRARTLAQDCPTTVSSIAASRTVAQYIDNVYHEWEEYELGHSPDGILFCVQQVKPVKKKLSAKDARTLLEKSSRWKNNLTPLETPTVRPAKQLKTRDTRIDRNSTKSLFDFDSLADAEPDTAAPPLYPQGEISMTLDDYAADIQPKGAVGSDDRIRIADTSVYPFNTISYMSMSFPDGGYRGSGWLVGPHSILTCAHNVYDKDTNTQVLVMEATPGQYYSGGLISEPYGSRSISRVMYPSQYVKAKPGIKPFDYDYAVVNFNTPFVGNGTYMPLEFGVTPKSNELIYVTGYPANVSYSNVFDMFTHADYLTGSSPRRLEFTTDASPGNSGGPVYLGSHDSPRPISVLTYGYTDNSANGATRLTSSNKASITEWMQYDPDAYAEVDLGIYSGKVKYNSKKGSLQVQLSFTNQVAKEATGNFNIYISNDAVPDFADWHAYEAGINIPSSLYGKTGKLNKKPKPYKVKYNFSVDDNLSGKYLIFTVYSPDDPNLIDNILPVGPLK